MFRVLSLFLITFLFISCNEKNPFSKTLKFGVYESPPRMIFDKLGNVEGIYIDILEEVNKGSGYNIEYVKGDLSELRDYLKKGKIDVLVLSHSSYRDSIFDFTLQPVLQSWLEIFTTSKTTFSGIKDFNNKRIGLLKGSSQEFFIKDTFRLTNDLNYTVKTYKSNNDIITGLKANEIDIAITSRFYFLTVMDDPEIIYRDFILYPTNLYFTFPKGAHPDLIEHFDKGLTRLISDPESVYYMSTPYWINKLSTKHSYKLVIIIVLSVALLLVTLIFLRKFVLLNYLQKKELVLRNQKLLELKEKAENANKQKTLLLQAVSHEIRTPINSILGFNELLKNKEIDGEEIEKYNSIVKNNSERLLDAVKDLIHYSKIETEKININISPTDVIEVLHFLRDSYSKSAVDKNLFLNLEIPKNTQKLLLQTDKTLLISILSNLIKNAIKYTIEGGIVFGYYIEKNWIRFYVRDSGVGIPNNNEQDIFEPFVRLKNTLDEDGYGIGLTIVKSFTEKLNGKISYESTENYGSLFKVDFPFQPINQETENKKEKIEKKVNITSCPLKILVAEDDSFSSLLIEKYLHAPNVEIILAHNGEEAIKLYEENIKSVNMVVLDIKMPKKDGLEVLAHIRDKDKNIPIIMQTAYALNEVVESCEKLGCSAFLEKPLFKNTLINAINELSSPPN